VPDVTVRLSDVQILSERLANCHDLISGDEEQDRDDHLVRDHVAEVSDRQQERPREIGQDIDPARLAHPVVVHGAEDDDPERRRHVHVGGGRLRESSTVYIRGQSARTMGRLAAVLALVKARQDEFDAEHYVAE
jgi:hypothetical protein